MTSGIPSRSSKKSHHKRMTHACQYGADHSGWNKHIRCTTKPHYALVHSFPCGRHYPYLWWWRSFHCDRLGRHLPSLKKIIMTKKKNIYIYIYTWNLYTFRFLIKKAMDEVCTCHTKGKILLLLWREGVTWQVLSNQIPIYIYIYSVKTRSVRHDLVPIIFPYGPPTQSLKHFIIDH